LLPPHPIAQRRKALVALRREALVALRCDFVTSLVRSDYHGDTPESLHRGSIC
jgi:hypothetical protein